MLWEAAITALVAGFAPWTLLIIAGLLGRERPMRYALVFLTSAAVVALLVGFLVVEALGGTDLEDRHRHHSVSPAIDLGLGIAILLFVPVLVHRMRHKGEKQADKRSAEHGDKPRKSRWHLEHLERLKRRRRKDDGARQRERREAAGVLAVVALGAFAGSPSPLYLASLHSITKGRPGTTVGTLEVLLIGALFLLMAEVPIIFYALAPERTTALLTRANAWLGRHGRILGVLAAGAVGCYFVITGIVHLV